MNRFSSFIFLWMFFGIIIQNAQGQDITISKLIWKFNKIDLGIVLEEQGMQEIIFDFTTSQDSAYQIQKVWTDCGCTTVDYSQDSLQVGDSGFVKVAFDPSSGTGFFSRMIVVHGNLYGAQDTLFVEGIAVPLPQNPQSDYPFLKNQIGFRLSKINMGEVFTNEPKRKQVEIFNFGNAALYQADLEYQGFSYLEVKQIQEIIPPQQRGILEFSYDANIKSEMGFAEDGLAMSWKDKQPINIEIIANVFEYSAPFPKENLSIVPQLWIENKEIDLKTIPSFQIQMQVFNLLNKGQEVLEIRKIQGNCECLQIEMNKKSLEPGESGEVRISFDPKGRFGIDQRNIHIFSNDPVNPIQLVILKSRVE